MLDAGWVNQRRKFPNHKQRIVPRGRLVGLADGKRHTIHDFDSLLHHYRGDDRADDGDHVRRHQCGARQERGLRGSVRTDSVLGTMRRSFRAELYTGDAAD